jgi:hypothetical protein
MVRIPKIILYVYIANPSIPYGTGSLFIDSPQIGLAMAGAEKLFDKKHKKGGSQSSSSSDNENGAKKDGLSTSLHSHQSRILHH